MKQIYKSVVNKYLRKDTKRLRILLTHMLFDWQSSAVNQCIHPEKNGHSGVPYKSPFPLK